MLHCIKQYDSIVKVGICMGYGSVHCPKTILMTSYAMKTTFNGPPNINMWHLKARKHFRVARFWKNCQNLKFCLPHLPTHSHEARCLTKRWMAINLWHKNSIMDVRFEIQMSVLNSSLLSSVMLFFFMQQNHIKVLIFHINTFFEQHI